MKWNPEWTEEWAQQCVATYRKNYPEDEPKQENVPFKVQVEPKSVPWKVQIDWYGDDIEVEVIESKQKVSSVLDVQVTAFESHYAKTGKDVNLLYYLTSDEVKETQLKYDCALDDDERKAAKGQAKAITPGGTFTKRAEDGLVNASGLIQFDIDGQDNIGFDPIKCRQDLGHQPWCAFASLSISGNGVWGLALVGSDWRRSVTRLLDAIQSLGYNVDRAPSNVASLRYLSYDKDAIFNHAPLHLPPGKQRRKPTGHSTKPTTSDEERVEALCNAAQLQGVSILEDEQDWFKGARSLATLGNRGRDYFHSLSSLSAKYDYEDSEKKFDYALKTSNGRISLGTIFYLAKQAGLNFS